MSDLLGVLIRLTLATSVAIALTIVLRKTVRLRFGARAAYQLWLLTPAALLGGVLPVAPGLLPTVPALKFAFAPVEAAVVWSRQGGSPAGGETLILAIWAAGAILSFLWVIACQQRFLRLAEAGVAGPAVVGAAFPKVVLPADFETRFTPDERRLILAHERTHLAYRDSAFAGLIALIQCVGWFNPLVHLAAHLARLDQELACDADVIAQFPHERRSYADAMLKTQCSAAQLPLGCSWPARSIHPLEERIVMLKLVRPGKASRLAGAALVAALALGAAYTASATQGAPAPISSSAAEFADGLTMHLVDEHGGTSAKNGGVRLEPKAVISGGMVADAKAAVDQHGRSIVRFSLTPQGATRLAETTRGNVGRRLAILVDGKVVTAPVIRDPINGGAGEISGDFTPGEARALAAAIVQGRAAR